jgi:hypothetical protein
MTMRTSGKKITAIISSIFSIILTEKFSFLGMISPATKAPKIACTPIN